MEVRPPGGALAAIGSSREGLELQSRVDRPSSRRLCRLEDRLRHQEHTTQALIDRATRIYEDLSESRAKSHETWHGEKRERMLLRDHVRTITAAVKRIAKDIEEMERDQRDLEDRIRLDGSAIRKIGHNQSSLLARVTQGDAEVGRIGADLKTCQAQVKAVEERQMKLETQSVERFASLNSRLDDAMSKIKNLESDLGGKVERVETLVRHQMSLLESRVGGMVEDMRGVVASNRRWGQSERDRIVQQMAGKIELSRSIQDGRILNLEKLVDELQQERRAKSVGNAWIQAQKELVEVRCKALVEELRRECGEGFRAVKESIETMKRVMDDKRTLLEQKMEEQMRRLLQTVVVV
eukprot:m.3601 g.3601  ORF g.3601 m.3601 type:complete len:352 (+) comp9612_c0_seq1:180-1235(+)